MQDVDMTLLLFFSIHTYEAIITSLKPIKTSQLVLSTVLNKMCSKICSEKWVFPLQNIRSPIFYHPYKWKTATLSLERNVLETDFKQIVLYIYQCVVSALGALAVMIWEKMIIIEGISTYVLLSHSTWMLMFCCFFFKESKWK